MGKLGGEVAILLQEFRRRKTGGERNNTAMVRHSHAQDSPRPPPKVYLKLDQPLVALDEYSSALERHVGDTTLLLALARVHDMLNQVLKGVGLYKQVLHYDSINAEAISCLASHHFYTDQPEIALRFYRRLLQTGQARSAELWNNLGLCCFYSGQYDLCLTCFERALMLADDTSMADVW